jgi:hypothetical protein
MKHERVCETTQPCAVILGTFDADLVAVEARRAMLRVAAPVPVPVSAPDTTSPAATINRPSASLAGYDQLLGHNLQEAAT